MIMPEPVKKCSTGKKKIIVIKDGPYRVVGGVPLVHKTQVVSEYGEPLTWKKDGEYEIKSDEYGLCRCGKSEKMPFCDGAHKKTGFNGTEQAKTDGPSEYQFTYDGGTNLIVKNDPPLCMNSGYCAMKNLDISEIIADSDNTMARSVAIAMVERCPSGTLTYRIEEGGEDIEPDYPQEIAVTTEITSDGPIDGPLWVTGYIPIERTDGQPFEARNRITLCNCGLSTNKPLCDGTHRDVAEKIARSQD
jgi:CDGSH-type Zn-finger protein